MKKILDLMSLKKAEEGVLNYMLLSNDNFLKIKNKLSVDDFTFVMHKFIFINLMQFEEMFLSDEYQKSDSKDTLYSFAEILNKHEDTNIVLILDILSQPPSLYIESDLELINTFAMEKEIAIHNEKIQRKIKHEKQC